MHIFEFSFLATGIVYSLLFDPRAIFIFILFGMAYLIIATLFPNQYTSTRRKIMFATWTEPSVGMIRCKLELPVDRVLETLEKIPKEHRPTLTHFVARAIGELVKRYPSINGKIVWGKFVPHKNVNISCLVDVDGGKDLAAVLVPAIDKMSVQQVKDFIANKAKEIKKHSGDADHKKRTLSARILPAFVVQILLKVTTFINCNLGLDMPMFGLHKDNFGVATLTSVGMLGFKDAAAPLCPFFNNVFIVTLNQVHERPIVQKGQVIIGQVVILNITVDHRYVDGGAAKGIFNVISDVFANPEEFMELCAKKSV